MTGVGAGWGWKGSGPQLPRAKEEVLVIAVLARDGLFNGIAVLVRVHHRGTLIVLLSSTLPCLCLAACCIPYSKQHP